MENKKQDTWTITATFTVFANEMDKDLVEKNALDILEKNLDGSDITSISIVDAKRDEI